MQLSNAYGSHTAIVPVMNTTITTSNIFISLHYLEVIIYFFLNSEIIKFVWQNNAPTNPPSIAIITHIGIISFVNTEAFTNALNLAYLKKLLFPLTRVSNNHNVPHENIVETNVLAVKITFQKVAASSIANNIPPIGDPNAPATPAAPPADTKSLFFRSFLYLKANNLLPPNCIVDKLAPTTAPI